MKYISEQSLYQIQHHLVIIIRIRLHKLKLKKKLKMDK